MIKPVYVCTLLLLATTGFGKKVDFKACGEDHLGVSSVDITPYPPHPGDTLTIVVQGMNDIDLQAGSRVSMAVSEGGIPVPATSYDLCASLSGDVHCPVKSGTTSSATFSYRVPRIALPGTAKSVVTTFDPQGRQISCITVDIDIAVAVETSFLRGGTISSDTVTGEDDS